MDVGEIFCFCEFDLVEDADDATDAGAASLLGKVQSKRMGMGRTKHRNQRPPLFRLSASSSSVT